MDSVWDFVLYEWDDPFPEPAQEEEKEDSNEAILYFIIEIIGNPW